MEGDGDIYSVEYNPICIGWILYVGETCVHVSQRPDGFAVTTPKGNCPLSAKFVYTESPEVRS